MKSKSENKLGHSKELATEFNKSPLPAHVAVLVTLIRHYRAALTWAVSHGKQPENCVMLNGLVRLREDNL